MNVKQIKATLINAETVSVDRLYFNTTIQLIFHDKDSAEEISIEQSEVWRDDYVKGTYNKIKEYMPFQKLHINFPIGCEAFSDFIGTDFIFDLRDNKRITAISRIKSKMGEKEEPISSKIPHLCGYDKT